MVGKILCVNGFDPLSLTLKHLHHLFRFVQRFTKARAYHFFMQPVKVVFMVMFMMMIMMMMLIVMLMNLYISGKLLSTILSLPSKRVSGIPTGCSGSLMLMLMLKKERMPDVLRLGHLLEKSHQMAQLFDVLNLLIVSFMAN